MKKINHNYGYGSGSGYGDGYGSGSGYGTESGYGSGYILDSCFRIIGSSEELFKNFSLKRLLESKDLEGKTYLFDVLNSYIKNK